MVDVLRIQLKIKELEERKALLANKKSAHTAVINQIIGRTLTREIVVKDSLTFAVLPYEKDSLKGLILRTHPMFSALEAQQEISRESMKVNNLAQKPVFAVGMDYIVVTKRQDASPNHNGRDIIMPRASVNIPLNRKKYEAKDKEEELRIAMLTTKKQAVLEQYMVEIEKAYTEYQEAQIKLNAYKQQTEILRRTIDLLVTQYSVSSRGFDELLKLHNDLIIFDLKALCSVVDSHLAKAKIEQFFSD